MDAMTSPHPPAVRRSLSDHTRQEPTRRKHREPARTQRSGRVSTYEAEVEAFPEFEEEFEEEGEEEGEEFLGALGGIARGLSGMLGGG